MGINFRFPIPRSSKKKGFSVSMMEQWRFWYRPPWVFLIHIFQFLCILFFLVFVSLPTIHSVHDYVQIFSSNLFPDKDDNVPYSNIEEIESFIDDFMNNLESIYKKSFINFHFSNKSMPFLFKVMWKNGSLTESVDVRFPKDFDQHILYFDLYTKFITISDLMPIEGCTEWEVNVKVYRSTGSYLFKTEPTINRMNCLSDIVTTNTTKKAPKEHRTKTKPTKSGFKYLYNENYTQRDREILKNIRESIENGTLESYISPPSPKTITTFVRDYLPLYHTTSRLSLLLIITSVVQIINISITIYNHFHRYIFNKDKDNQLTDLGPGEKFHTVIGYWDPFFLFTNIILLICSALIFKETQSMTQYISPKSLHAFGVSAFFIIVTLLRWLRSSFGCYTVVLIVRYAILRLFDLILAQSPFIIAMMLISVFLFGLVTRATESFIVLFEMILALTFGDNIYGFYQAYTDGSHAYNVHAFIYVTILTVLTMWLFFPTYTASIMYVHHHFIAILNPKHQENSEDNHRNTISAYIQQNPIPNNNNNNNNNQNKDVRRELL